MGKTNGVPSKKHLLPHYYRLITAWVTAHLFLVLIIAEVFVFAVCCVLFSVVYLQYLDTKSKRAGEVFQLLTWEEAIKKYPSYPQAYYNAALHAARLGDSQKALTYIQKSLSLNENYEPAKQLKNLLVE